jgi:hypothetical protein
MDAQKIHTLLNYLPLVGTLIGIATLLIGMWRSNDKLRLIGLGLFCLTALVTLAVFATGEIAGKGSEIMVGQVWENIRAHKASALPTFIAVEIAGVFALFGIISIARKRVLARWVVVAVMLFAIAAIGLSARTVLLGRQIFAIDTTVSK